MKYIFFLIAFFFVQEVKANDTEQFKTFVTNDTNYNNVLKLSIERVFRLSNPECSEQIKLSKRFQEPLTETVFPEPQKEDKGETKQDDKTDVKEKETNPLFGQWIERVLVQSCDKQMTINHLAVAYDSITPIILPLLNGQTRLDAIDQPFAEKAIAERLTKLERPCESKAFIIDTSVIGYRTKDGKSLDRNDNGNGWFEKWNIRACDTNYEINLAVLPDPKLRHRYIVRLAKS